MIARFDSFNRYETPSIMLCGADSEYKDGVVTSVIGYLTDISDEELVLNFSTTSELNFRAYQISRDDESDNSVMLDIYSKLKNRRLLFVEDVGYFAITNVEEQFSDGMSYKDITATSCEVEFENRKVPYIGQTIESADGDGKTEVDYTYAFRDLLDLLVGSVPKWTYDPDNIDSAVLNKFRTFEDVDDDENILAFMQKEVQEAYECVFDFDIINRTVSVYDQNSFASETSIHLTKDDIITELDISENSDDLYTALSVFGDSDDISINGVNPLGTNVIYNFDYYLSWMSPALQSKLKDWEADVAAGESAIQAKGSEYVTKKQEYLNQQLEIERLEQLIQLYTRAESNIRVALISAPATTEGNEDVDQAKINKAKEIIADYNKEITRIFGKERPEYRIDDSVLSIENESISIPKQQAESDLADAKGSLSALKTEVDAHDNELGELAKNLKLQVYLGDELFAELSNYIYEGSYSDTYITVTDKMTQAEIHDQSLTLYNRAKAQLGKISAPTQKFDVDTESFIFAKEFLPWSEQLNTGACVNVEVAENDIASLFLTTITVNFYDKTLKLTFGNRLKRNDPKALYEDILGNVRKTANSLSYLNEVVSPVKVGLLDDFAQQLQNSRNLTMRNALSATNQSFTMDNLGITGSSVNGDGSLGPYQIKITNESIVFTTDGWKTCSTALGRFFYTNPEDGESKSTYGVNAEVVAGAKIFGSSILGGDIEGTAIHGGTIWGTDIYATDVDPRTITDPDLVKNLAYMKYNADTKKGEIYGFEVKGATITGGKVRTSTGEAWMEDGNITGGVITGATINGGEININDNFVVDSEGNVSLNGNITWGVGASSPIRALYGTDKYSKPTQSYSSYPSIDLNGWHTMLDVDYDFYASYSYDGGNTWTDAIKIQGEDGSDANISRDRIAEVLLTEAEALSLGDGIYSKVSGGETRILVNASAIKAGTIDADYVTVAGSTVTLSNNSIMYKKEDSIYVTMNETGIELSVKGSDSIPKRGKLVGMTGNTGGYLTDGIALINGTNAANPIHYVIVTTAGARVQSTNSDVTASGNSAHLRHLSSDVTNTVHANKSGCAMNYNNSARIYVDSVGCHATSAITTGSDRRIKKNIEYDCSKYEQFFMKLQPVSYEYISEPNPKLHTGFIAQDVEEALYTSGLTNDDFAGLLPPSNSDEDFSSEDYSSENSYMLAYSEFTSLNTYMIQKLYDRVEALEKELAKLRSAEEKG